MRLAGAGELDLVLARLRQDGGVLPLDSVAPALFSVSAIQAVAVSGSMVTALPARSFSPSAKAPMGCTVTPLPRWAVRPPVNFASSTNQVA